MHRYLFLEDWGRHYRDLAITLPESGSGEPGSALLKLSNDN